MRKTVMLIYRSNKLFLALGAGDAVDDMPRLKGKISKVLSRERDYKKLNLVKEGSRA